MYFEDKIHGAFNITKVIMFYIVANKILYPKAITVFDILGLKMAFFNNNVPKNYQKIAKKKV